MTNSIAEIEDARCILVIGSNTTAAHPLVASRIFRAKEKGAKLIVIDPRNIQLTSFADVHVRPKLGTNVALINGTMHIIISENWYNKEFVQSRTEGFEDLRKKLDAYPPERVAQITGVAPQDVRIIAEWYAKSQTASIIYAMGITQYTTGVDNVKSLANLSMLCGHIGRESTGVNPLRGQNNVQGACDMGALPNVYPGYQPVTDDAINNKFSEAWHRPLPKGVGLTILEMFKGIDEGRIKALYVMGENPMLSDPDIHHVEKSLKALDLLVVQDIFLTETANLAHAVLPGASFAEKDGTFTNTERRVQRVRKAIEPIGECRPDWKIICDLSQEMGYLMEYQTPQAIQNEIAALTPNYGGIYYDRLEKEGLQWPCADRSHPGTKFLHKGRFTRGLGLFHAIDYKPPAELADAQFPFLLTTGRAFMHFHTGTMTRESPSLAREMNECYVEINPADASQLRIIEGGMVKITSRRGEVKTKARITDTVDRGTVFMPFHFAESAANILTNPAYDPVAKIPEFKVCAVSITVAE